MNIKKYFLDTCTLIKLYHEEAASGIIAFQNFDAKLFITSDKALVGIAKEILSHTLFV